MYGVISQVIHDFKTSLSLSHDISDDGIWLNIYQNFFGDAFVAMHDNRENGWWQQAGVDRTIILTGSKVVRIDEKVRPLREDGKVFTDILLEYLSDEERQVSGWVCKPLYCDYIAYLNQATEYCYMLPVIPLQNAWKYFGEKWIQSYKKICAYNRSSSHKWTTVSVGVPVDILQGAITRIQTLNVKKIRSQKKHD